jgi:hypothetical protein
MTIELADLLGKSVRAREDGAPVGRIEEFRAERSGSVLTWNTN